MKGKKEKFNSFTYILKFIMGVLSWTVFVILVLIHNKNQLLFICRPFHSIQIKRALPVSTSRESPVFWSYREGSVKR